MSVLIICKSATGNTQKIAKAMATFSSADILTPEEALKVNISKYDLIGFGSGIYNGQHDPALFTLLKAQSYHHKDAFVFSTSGIGTVLYHAKLNELLLRKGFEVHEEFACKGENKHGPFGFYKYFNITTGKGRPNEKDLQDAAIFIKKIMHRLGLEKS
jgi:flavodoxin